MLVQILRQTDKELLVQQNTREGKERMVVVHGNRFLERQIFRRMSLDGLDKISADLTGLYPEVSRLAPILTDLTISWTNTL